MKNKKKKSVGKTEKDTWGKTKLPEWFRIEIIWKCIIKYSNKDLETSNLVYMSPQEVD